jgi:hypothetical protein
MRLGLKGESGEDIGPAILGRFGRFGYDAELALGMMDDGYGVHGGGANGPASAQKVDFLIRVDPTAQVDRQLEIHEGGGRTGAQDGTLLV